MQTGRRILSYLKPYKRRLVIIYIALFGGVAMQLGIPLLLARAIDQGIVERDLTYLGQVAAAIVALAALQGIFTFVRSYYVNALSETIGFDLRNELYHKFQALPFGFYDRAQTGQLMSRATDDINQIRGALMMSLRALPHSVALLAGVTIILFWTDWLLALVALSTMPFLIFWSIRFGIAIRPVFLQVQQQFGVMTSTLQENVAGGRVVRAFAQEGPESERFEAELDELFQRELRAAKGWSFNYPMTLALSGLSLAGVLWVGGYQVLTGVITVGTLVAFERFTILLNEPIRWLGFVVNRIARALASGERIFEILDTKPAIADRLDAVAVDQVRGEVRFDHVDFKYRGARSEALHDVDLVAEPGQIVALVGPTGSGKSSVINLIPRFYDVSNGRVLIDGRDVREFTLASLRRHIGVVLQESFLFSVTIRENIAYGRPDATLEQVEAAAKAARAHEFIMRMPQGYDTVVGERGVSLSGGQRQRVAIARALLLDPRILILDDATSSVDSETEHLIQQALRRLMAGRTSFVIAQRLTTIKDADQILVFQDGRITQRGTHDDLVEQEGFYRELYDLQLRDQETASGAAALLNGGEDSGSTYQSDGDGRRDEPVPAAAGSRVATTAATSTTTTSAHGDSPTPRTRNGQGRP